MRRADPDGPTSTRVRLFASFAGLAIGVAGIAFLVSVFRPGSADRPAAGSVSDIVRVSCQDGATKVETPQVRVRADGLHVRMEADFDQPVLTMFHQEGRSAHGLGPHYPGRSNTFVESIPPGEVTFDCGQNEVDKPSDDAVTVQVTDPDGVWHASVPACGTDFFEWDPPAHPFYYTDHNPFPQVMYRTLPGLRPDDEISFAGYRDNHGGAFRIVREGEVVGDFSLGTYDQRTFVVYGLFCNSSGIGAADADVVGTTSTPFHLPGYAGCDPYSGSCSSLFLSASRYEELTGESPRLVSSSPWAACSEYTSAGCLPEAKDMVVRVVTTQDDAARFEEKYDCGRTEQAACS